MMDEQEQLRKMTSDYYEAKAEIGLLSEKLKRSEYHLQQQTRDRNIALVSLLAAIIFFSVMIGISRHKREESSYSDGYDIGYSEGFSAGEREHENDYSKGYDEGFFDAQPSNDRYDEGYKDGYYTGFDEGYSDAEEYHENDQSNGYKDGYSDGYSNGYEDAQAGLQFDPES